MPHNRVLVIIPAYNEAGRVASVIHSLRSKYPAFDLLVINDCSNDSTAQEASGSGTKVVSLPFNLGIGGAVQTGFQYAKENDYDIAIQVDGDGQHDPQYLAKILDPVVSGELDMCIGSRFLSEGGFKSFFLRRIGIHFFCWLIGILTGRKLTDPTSGFRAVGTRLINLFAQNYPIDFPEPESIVTAQKSGAKIGEVSVVMRQRLSGNSSIRYLKSAYYMLKVTLAIILCTLKKSKESGWK